MQSFHITIYTMKPQKFSFSKRIKSFAFALNGLKVLFQEEHNARVHLFATIIVTSTGIFFNLSSLEWVALIFAIGFVITVEIINTTVENISDFISPEKNNSIKKIKDLAAGAVLISALTALTIGLVIFIPKVYILLNT